MKRHAPMKKILIKHFPNLNNYGTGMMGLVLLQYLVERFGDDLEITCDFSSDRVIPEVLEELPRNVRLNRFLPAGKARMDAIKFGLFKKTYQLYDAVKADHLKEFDGIVVLGGDDLSEYYGKYSAAKEAFALSCAGKKTEIFLLGQTIGPFQRFLNRFFVKRLLKRAITMLRDPWTYSYLKDSLHVDDKNLRRGADLAFCDLPLQADRSVEEEILGHYHLERNGYVTIIVSALQREGYYCRDKAKYLDAWRALVERIASHHALEDKKICLLAHTFGGYGDEAEYLEELYRLLSPEAKSRIVRIQDRILPTRARFVLGNGMFTITGRMHAGVSTFQMGKPAILLSYSKKYEGVFGQGLGREDLIIECNDDELWESGEIVTLISRKIDDVIDRYDTLTKEIKAGVAELSSSVRRVLDQCFCDAETTR